MILPMPCEVARKLRQFRFPGLP